MSVNDTEFMRYSRQILLPEMGEIGQQKLKLAHVAIIGVGGLGSVVADYLSSAGIGLIKLVDHDVVELSNLPRQLLFSHNDINQNKAVAAANNLKSKGVTSEILSFEEKLSANNSDDVLKGIDIVFDCTDDFVTRQVINEACVKNSTVLVSASVANFTGQLLVVDPISLADAGCYACLFPADSVVNQTCQTVGVLGPMVGVMAAMQALIGMKSLLGLQTPQGKLLRFDGDNMQWREASRTRDLHCPCCGHVRVQDEVTHRTEAETPSESASNQCQ